MKKIYIILLCLITYTVVGAQPYAGGVTVTCSSLEERGEILYLNLKIAVEREALNKVQSWTITPRLIGAAGKKIDFPRVLVQGNNKRKLYNRRAQYNRYDMRWQIDRPYEVINVKKSDQMTKRLNYVMQIPYAAWMDDAKLEIHQILGSPASKEQYFVIQLDKGVKLQPREPYAVKPVVAFDTPAKELVKSRKIQAQAYLDFQVGRSVIVPTFRRNPEELRKIQQTLQGVQRNPDVSITGMFIEGYASPEGRYETNARLAAERANALKLYVGDNFGVERGIISTSSVAEDWDGLKILVEESNMANKDAILAIINSEIAPDAKETRIKGYATQYRQMLNEMFPQLRRSDYRIDFTVKDFSVAESKAVLDKDPSMLSHYELFTLAASYSTGGHEYNKIYDLIIRMFPDDQIAIVNSATVMFQNGEYTGAKNRLEAAPKPTAQGLNTLGAIYLKEGNLDRAEMLLKQARDMGSKEAVTNLAEVAKKRADNEKMKRYNR